MEDDGIKGLFNDFQPEMSSPLLFMTQLQKKMEAVEIVKEHQLALKERNRRAVVIAAFAGFVTGVILTMVFSFLCTRIPTVSISLPQLHITGLVIDFSVLSWIIVGAICVVTSLNVYETASAKLSLKGVADN